MGALMFSRAGTQVQVSGLMLLAEILFGMNVKKPSFLSWERRFFYWFYERPRDKGQQKRR